jgi:hypothetical protein
VQDLRVELESTSAAAAAAQGERAALKVRLLCRCLTALSFHGSGSAPPAWWRVCARLLLDRLVELRGKLAPMTDVASLPSTRLP